MDWKQILATVVLAAVVIISVAACCGIFAYDRGVYLSVEGASVTDFFGSHPRGVMLTVWIDRGLGRDRRVFSSANFQQVWTVYKAMTPPPTPYRYANPGGP